MSFDRPEELRVVMYGPGAKAVYRNEVSTPMADTF
jgi:hypothetical protein